MSVIPSSPERCNNPAHAVVAHFRKPKHEFCCIASYGEEIQQWHYWTSCRRIRGRLLSVITRQRFQNSTWPWTRMKFSVTCERGTISSKFGTSTNFHFGLMGPNWTTNRWTDRMHHSVVLSLFSIGRAVCIIAYCSAAQCKHIYKCSTCEFVW